MTDFLINTKEIDVQYMVPSISSVIAMKCPATWEMNESIVLSHVFLLVASGILYVSFDGSNQVETVEQGNLVYYPKFTMRRSYTSKDNPIYCYAVKFDYVLFDQKEEEACISSGEKPLPIPRITKLNDLKIITDIFRDINMAWTSKDNGHILRCNSLFINLIYRIIRENQCNTHGYFYINTVKKAMNYIFVHHTENIHLKQISDHVGLSPSYFGKIFKEISGFSPKGYLNYIRANRAKDLLLSGRYLIGEVAEMMGYCDVYYFSRIFKKITGDNPSKYK